MCKLWKYAWFSILWGNYFLEFDVYNSFNANFFITTDVLFIENIVVRVQSLRFVWEIS